MEVKLIKELSSPIKHNKSWAWNEYEHKKLMHFVRIYGTNWEVISKKLKKKDKHQCKQKYEELVRTQRKGKWSLEEDFLLQNWVKEHGPRKWSKCSKVVLGRCGKQCRERWLFSLDPQIKKGAWEESEQIQIFYLIRNHLCCWSAISKGIPKRPENLIKNFFYYSIRKLKSLYFFNFLKCFLLQNRLSSGNKNNYFLYDLQKISYFCK